MQARAICLIFFGSLGLSTTAQVKQDTGNYSEVDSFALSVKYKNDYILLSKELTAPYYDDTRKLRSIFKWITANIEYDYRFINNGKEIIEPECSDKIDCSLIQQDWENRYIKRILKTRKAVADGYCRLFKKLCELNNIQCEMISGYARTKAYQVGNPMSVNHCWNAVMIDTNWFYTDVTWAAGFCIEDDETGRLLRYVKDFKEYYWLKSFTEFSRNHYPKKGYFTETTSLSKEQFFNKPFYYSVEVLENIKENVPATGVIKVKKSDTIFFSFEYKKEIRQIQINSNVYRNPSLWMTVPAGRKKTKLVKDSWAEKKQQYIPFEKHDNCYSFYYVVKDMSLYYLELSFDFKPSIRYRVRVEN